MTQYHTLDLDIKILYSVKGSQDLMLLIGAGNSCTGLILTKILIMNSKILDKQVITICILLLF